MAERPVVPAPDSPAAAHPPRLLPVFARGASWKIGSQILAQGLRLGTTLVVAHLVAPADYGLAAMALVLAAFAVAFSDVGFGAAIVQRNVLAPVDLSTAFWISVACGVLFTTATAALAHPIAMAYAHPKVELLVLGISPIFFLDSLATTQRALLARHVDFRSLELRGLAGAAAGSAAAITCACLGAGAWSLIVQELVVAAIGTWLLWRISPWRPSLAFSTSSMRELGSYALRRAASRLLSDVNDTADNVLVGRFLGATPLAIYTVAYKTALRPMVSLVSPLQEVLFPVLSRAQNDSRRIGEAWVRVTRVTAALTIPTLCGVAVLAPEFVHVVLGARWDATAGILRILAVVGAVQALTAGTSSVLGAISAMQLQLRLAVARTTTNVAAFVVGLHWGLTGVAAAYACASVLLLVPTVHLTARQVGLSTLDVARALGGTVQATAAMLVFLLFVRQAVDEVGIAPGPELTLLVGLAASVYFATLTWRDAALRTDVYEVAIRFRRRREAIA